MTLLKKITATAAVVAAAGTLVATEVQATEGYFQNAIGARSKALAGAGVADSKDATAITLNPAGLVHAGRQFNGSLSFFMPFRQYSANRETAGGPGTSVLAEGTHKSGRNIFYVPNIAYSHPISEDSVIAFSMSGNGGMNSSYDDHANTSPNCIGLTPVASGSGAFCGGKAGIDLTQLNLSAAYATKIGDHLSIGISPIFAIQRFKAKGLEAFALSGFSSSPTNLSDKGYDYSFGGGVRLGVEFALDENIRVGASYQTKLLMSRLDKYSGLFAERGGFDIPANMQFGVAFDATPDLTLMADFRHIFYSDVKSVNNQNPGDLLGLAGGSGFGWRDVSTIKLAAEYNATEALTVRAGYSYNTQPIRNSQVLFNVLAPATVQHHITGGGSYKFTPNSEFEFAAMYAPSKKITGRTGAVQFTSIKMHQLEFTVGYNYHWN